jgi:hypothetical protein
LLFGAQARAERGEGAGPDVERTESTIEGSAAIGSFLALSQAASLEEQRALVATFGGYDSARRASSFEAAAEVRVWGPVAIRGGAVYTSGGGNLRPSVGARLQVLREGRHGVDAAMGVFYRPEGLTEPEGEIESVISVGRRAGGIYWLGNILYGQDPEGRERDGEMRVAALRAMGSNWLVGLDSRVRFDLGSDSALLAQHMEPTFDLLAGPSGTLVLGSLALSAQAGGAGVRLQQRTSYGAFGLVGLGSAF